MQEANRIYGEIFTIMVNILFCFWSSNQQQSVGEIQVGKKRHIKQQGGNLEDPWITIRSIIILICMLLDRTNFEGQTQEVRYILGIKHRYKELLIWIWASKNASLVIMI